MSFEFVKFPGAARGFSARVSLRKNGQLGFNNGAVMHYELQRYPRATLHFDATNRVIGILPVTTEEDPAACRIVHRPGNSYIAAKTFCDYFQISAAEETTRYELKKDDATGMLIMELTKPLAVKHRKRGLDGGEEMC
jgi:hypothetical protein